jgi:hypothetical protein
VDEVWDIGFNAVGERASISGIIPAPFTTVRVRLHFWTALNLGPSADILEAAIFFNNAAPTASTVFDPNVFVDGPLTFSPIANPGSITYTDAESLSPPLVIQGTPSAGGRFTLFLRRGPDFAPSPVHVTNIRMEFSA